MLNQNVILCRVVCEQRGAFMEMYIDIAMGLIITVGGWWCKSQHDELKRVTVLLNRTREEIAKEYVSVSRQQSDMDRVIDRLDRLEGKLDRLMER
jgi:hypothetical protein